LKKRGRNRPPQGRAPRAEPKKLAKALRQWDIAWRSKKNSVTEKHTQKTLPYGTRQRGLILDTGQKKMLKNVKKRLNAGTGRGRGGFHHQKIAETERAEQTKKAENVGGVCRCMLQGRGEQEGLRNEERKRAGSKARVPGKGAS